MLADALGPGRASHLLVVRVVQHVRALQVVIRQKAMRIVGGYEAPPFLHAPEAHDRREMLFIVPAIEFLQMWWIDVDLHMQKAASARIRQGILLL